MPWTAICYCNLYWCGGKGTLARLGFPSMHAAHPVSRGWRVHFGVAQGGRAATLMRLGSHSPPLATSLPRWLGHTAPRWRRAKPPRPRTPQRVGKAAASAKRARNTYDHECYSVTIHPRSTSNRRSKLPCISIATATSKLAKFKR